MVATTPLGPSDIRTTETFVKHLPHGPVDDVVAFMGKLQTALGTPFAGEHPDLSNEWPDNCDCEHACGHSFRRPNTDANAHSGEPCLA